MGRQGSRFLSAAVLSSALFVLGACEARDPGQVDGTTPPGAMADRSAGSVVTLTGCLQRGVAPGEYVLASVGTAGVIGTTGEAEDQGRSWTVDPAETDRAAGRVASATSYRLVTMGEREDLEQYHGQRVAVRGRLAPETPAAGAGQDEEIPAEGRVVESGPTQAVVEGQAPPLQGLYYESVRRVADTCEP